MNQQVRLDDGTTVRVERDIEWLSSDIPVLDPDWHQPAGDHEHTLKDLIWVVDWEVPAGCCGTHSEGHWECPVCGDRVAPGVKIPEPAMMVSYERWFVNDEPATREQVLEITRRSFR